MEKAILALWLIYSLNGGYTKPIWINHQMDNQIIHQIEKQGKTQSIKESITKKAKQSFQKEIDQSTIMPEGTSIKNIYWDGQVLTMDLSSQISSYGGGTAIEYAIQQELLDTAFGIQEVKKFTLLIEGKQEYLPEGTFLVNYSRERWKKLFKDIEYNTREDEEKCKELTKEQKIN